MAQSARWRLLGPAVLSVLLVALVLTAFALSVRSGQMVTADNALLYQLLALSLWSCLALSIVFSVWALASRELVLFALAAALSAVFSILALLSIGPFTFLLTVLQAAAALAMGLGLGRRRSFELLVSAAIVWAALFVPRLVPIWLHGRP